MSDKQDCLMICANEGMCKSNYGNQDFPQLANGESFQLHNGNSPITWSTHYRRYYQNGSSTYLWSLLHHHRGATAVFFSLKSR